MSTTSRASSGTWSQCLATRLSRTKSLDAEDILNTNLRRCLSTFDVTLLALGHMVGSGIYVLTATVAKNMAGPAIVLAFIFSGFATFLSALCYAELGVRYPRCGSSYSYTYLVLGELWAFLVGWNMALENIIGAASTARACSAYIDSLANGVIRNFTDSSLGPVDIGFLSQRLDFLALGIMLLFVAYLSFGIRMTSHLTNFFTVINMIVIIFFIGIGAYFSDINNWTNEDTGGFLPYEWSGVLSASASCFYAYVGFEIIASAGEETNDPQKTIPRATFISMTIAAVAYVGVSSVLTLMVNYKDIVDDSGLPEALAYHDVEWAKIAITVGALCGMATGIICCLYALTRIIYIMADDGLLFTLCSKISVKTKTPLTAMYLFSLVAALLAFILDITTLVELFSIGTLFAYLVVSASVIILRYRPQTVTVSFELPTISEANVSANPPVDNAGQLKENFRWLRPHIRMDPGRLVTCCVLAFTSFSFVLCGFATICFSYIIEGRWWAVLIVMFTSLALVLSFGVILLHQQSTAPVRYKVPFVPLVPSLSILLNALLMVSLQSTTWIRLLVWICIGLCLYFFYGIRNSKLEVVTPVGPGIPMSVASLDAPEKTGALKRISAITSSREYLFSSSIPR